MKSKPCQRSFHLLAAGSLALVMSACSSKETTTEDPIVATNGAEASAPSDGEPALAVATVASLISVSDVMVREPERFHKALCSDGNIYDLEYSGGRFSLRAEPPSVCVLLADTQDLKPKGFCGDALCSGAPISECGEAEKKELQASFAKEQSVQHCWNVGNYAPYAYAVLVTRVGQSCQAQTLVKNDKGWKSFSSLDGAFDTRRGEAGDVQGCWFEGSSGASLAAEWFNREKRVVPVMVFEKDKGAYTLMKTNWNGSENFQLLRIDGERLVEIESFAEAFKDSTPEPAPVPQPQVDEPAKGKEKAAKGKKAKKSQKSPVPQPKPEDAAPAEATPPESAPVETPAPEAAPEAPVDGEKVPDGGVNPLEGEG